MKTFDTILKILSLVFLIGCTTFLYNILVNQYTFKNDMLQVKIEIIDLKSNINNHTENQDIHIPKELNDARYISIRRFEAAMNSIDDKLTDDNNLNRILIHRD